MTIASAYLTSEGVVFGSDSATTITRVTPGQVDQVQLFDHAQKIFEIGKPGGGRFGICTWGAAMVGKASHRAMASRLADWVTPSVTVSEGAAQLVQMVRQELGANPLPGLLGYFIGGWTTPGHIPECIEIAFEPGKAPALTPFQVGEAKFRGAPQMFMRAYHGYDPELPQLVLNELNVLLQPPPANLEQMLQTAFNNAIQKITRGGFADMPIREAIDFIHMYLHLTIKAFKFRFGPQVVGGPIEIGFISCDRNFRWIRHKPFDSAVLEEEIGIQ